MHIAIVNLTAGGFSGGYRKYLRELVPLLAAATGVRIDVFSPAAATPLFAGTIAEHAIPARDPLRRALKDTLRTLGPDVVFVPTARAVTVPGIPTVCMVRNMEPLAVPFGGNGVMESLRNIARREAARAACRRAHRIIAVSGYVRDFLVDRWHIDPARIGVVHHGVEATSSAEATSRPAALTFDAAEPFLFSAGSLRPARGLDDLVDALAALKQQGRPPRAVIAGSATGDARRYLTRLQQRAGDVGLDPFVTWAGQLDAAEMAWCFRHAAAFIMTTRAEACPNTALEALAHGAAIIATDAPPLPEICADAATYYHARDASDLARRISETLALPAAERAARSAAARERAKAFDWRTTARRTLDELGVAIAEYRA